MSTDPFVAPTIDEEPRQEPNLAPGVQMPPSKAWRADRPGDLPAAGQPDGPLFGSPGPNIGYALTLAEKMRDQLVLSPQEHAEDVLAVVGALAMRRAASYGRAPVMPDLECAAIILGYVGQAPRELVEWRSFYVRGAAHDYALRREICDAVDLDLLRLAPQALAGRVVEDRDSDEWKVDSGARTLTQTSGRPDYGVRFYGWVLALHRTRGAPQGAPPLR
jgi:hypothetical protein